MGPSLDISIALLALAPFIAALFAPWVKAFLGAFAGWVLAIVPAAIFLSLLRYLEPIAAGEVVTASLPWVPAFDVAFSFFIDGLSLTFGLLISGIGTFIVIYSGGYLAGHPHQGRFFAFILMFMGSMLGLVLANDLITLFIFWELTSVTSFLLIGFDHSRQAARRAATQALVVTGGGGLALLLGLVVLMGVSGERELTALLAAQGTMQGDGAYIIVLVLVLAGAFAKSAQVPLHFWLPNAMEAPTPVSAFLHSATMVKAGVYLLARMNPVLGATAVWFWTLVLFGGATLLMGAFLAVRQTDIKQALAYTTMASLGLLVMLIGVGTKEAILGMVLYLVAHSLFKGGFFMIAGAIDHGTGTRDITALGGLRGKMPVTFLAAIIAAFSMSGLPIAMGFLAKEEMYLATTTALWPDLLVLAALVLGNALMMAVALSIAIKPFTGARVKSPHAPHEAGPALLAGPVILGLLGLVAGLFTPQLNTFLLSPTGTAVYTGAVTSEIYLAFDITNPAVWASIATWALGLLFFWRVDAVRSVLRRTGEAIGWTFDKGFDSVIFSLVRLGEGAMRVTQHGRLDWYMMLLFVLLIGALYIPMLVLGTFPALPAWPDLQLYEWGAFAIVAMGLIAVVALNIRLHAIVALGIQGFGVAVIFMLLGAPDLSFTQFMVETLSVVILALVMTRLHLDSSDRRDRAHAVRDGAIAVLTGLGIVLLMLTVLETDLDRFLTDFFNVTSTPIAHGRNIVNVILVDYRAIDTLGEISVVMATAIAILALIRVRAGRTPTPETGRGGKKGRKPA